MKKLILFSTFLLLDISIQAKEVFPTSDAIWNMHLYLNGTVSEMIYGLMGDTLIENKTYQKMYLLSDTILSLDKAEYVGGFRIEQEQVWFIPPSKKNPTYQHPEFLLYDFSKKEGETVYHGLVSYTPAYGPFFEGEEPYKEWTSTIYQVFTDEQGRKHIETNRGEWVEGIGGINGFFYTFYNYLTDGRSVSQQLACFKHNGIVEHNVYNVHILCDKCFCMQLYPGYVDIKNNEEEVSFILSVNPQKSEIQIQTPPSLQPAELNLYDLSGMLIHSQVLSRSYSSIELSSFQPGIYIYRINKLGKPLQSGKISIQ